MVRSIETRAEVEELFAARKEQHDARGIAATRLEILRLDWPSDGTAVGHVRWVHEDEEGREIGAESSTYVLCRDHVGTLKVRSRVDERTAPASIAARHPALCRLARAPVLPILLARRKVHLDRREVLVGD